MTVSTQQIINTTEVWCTRHICSYSEHFIFRFINSYGNSSGKLVLMFLCNGIDMRHCNDQFKSTVDSFYRTRSESISHVCYQWANKKYWSLSGGVMLASIYHRWILFLLLVSEVKYYCLIAFKVKVINVISCKWKLVSASVCCAV